MIAVTNLGLDETETIVLDRPAIHLSLSPNGQLIAYSSGERNDSNLHVNIHVHDRKTHSDKKVVSWPYNFTESVISSPAFISDDLVIFETTWFTKETSSLMTVNLNEGDIETILNDENIFIGPKASPNGKKIIYLCGGLDKRKELPGFQICLFDYKNNDIRLLTSDGGHHGSFLFTPDSKKVVYTEVEALRLIEHLRGPYRRVYSIDINGKNRQKVIDFEGAIRAISEDGQDIILEGRPNENYPYSIYIVDIDGSNLRHLTYFDEFLADWYPDEE